MAWHDGALSRYEANAVMAHLATCARCTALEQALLNDRREVFALLFSIDPQPGVAPQPASALAQFRARLAAQRSENSRYPDLHQEEKADRPVSSTLPTPVVERDDLRPTALPAAAPRRSRVWVQRLETAMIMALLLGTVLLLVWRPWRPSPAVPPVGTSVGTPIPVRAQAGGLEMTMRITPGPYFLREMLVADLSLTNHSQTTYLLEETLRDPGLLSDACQPPITVQISGGSGPSDTVLRNTLTSLASCSNRPGSEGTMKFKPGQTITAHQVLALTSSGQVTFTARGIFQKVVLGQDGVVQVANAPGPLDGHWPTMRVSVASQAPPARLISLQRQGLQVQVVAPPAIRTQLLIWASTSCIDRFGDGTGGGGSANWVALSGETITPDQCGVTSSNGTATTDKLKLWVYAVGAPGYAIALGMYQA